MLVSILSVDIIVVWTVLLTLSYDMQQDVCIPRGINVNSWPRTGQGKIITGMILNYLLHFSHVLLVRSSDAFTSPAC
jgi:hypothetical protein